MHTWRWSLILVLMSALGWVPRHSAASDAPLKIITIAGTPWGLIDNEGRQSGMIFEISSRIAERAGLPFTNTVVPYARSSALIESGAADLVLRFANPQLLSSAEVVTRLLPMPVVAVGSKGTNFHTLSDLHGKNIGVIRGSQYGVAFDTEIGIERHPVPDYAVMARMVAMGRLDGGVASAPGLCYGAYMAGIKREDLGRPLLLGTNDVVLFYAKKTYDPLRAKALKMAAARLVASGEVQQIFDKYMRICDYKPPQP